MFKQDIDLGDVEVYLVDDDEAVCDALGLVLEYNGATVTRLDCLDRARAALEVRKPDCMVIDIHLPDGMGWEILKESRGSDAPIPTIMMTGNIQQRSRDMAELLQVEILEKPLDGDVLTAAVARLVRRLGEPG